MEVAVYETRSVFRILQTTHLPSRLYSVKSSNTAIDHTAEPSLASNTTTDFGTAAEASSKNEILSGKIRD